MKNYNYIWIRAILFTISFIVCTNVFSVQTVKTYNYKFTDSDFQLVYENGKTNIKSTKYNLSLLKDTLKPAIPYITANILLPKDATLSNVSYKVVSEKSLGNYTLTNNPRLILNDGCFEMQESNEQSLAEGVFPRSLIENYVMNVMDGYRIASVQLSPFIYNADNNNLTLVTDINIEICFDNEASTGNGGKVMRKTVLSIIDNKEELILLYPENPQSKAIMRNSYVNDETDYLILTTDSLVDCFEELKTWSLQKGIKTRIVAVEDIYTNNSLSYDNKSLQIKSYIRNSYNNQGLKSVLLAGDYDIVPTKFCYGEVPNTTTGTITDDHLPTDLFYACFDNTFNWNANGNSLYGEVEDNIDMSPEIFVSRLPVRNSSHINNYITKLLRYEKNAENMNVYANKILFAGSGIFSSGGGGAVNSDTHDRGNRMYETLVAPYFAAPYHYLYDTGSSFSDADVFSADQIQTVLSKGFNIVHIDAHGEFDRWKVGDYTSRTEYTTEHASSLNSPNLTCIISSACFINNFAADTVCLSEAFIRSATSGNIAFIGNSDYGLSNLTGEGSIWINSEFFRKLFQHDMRGLGEIVSSIKHAYVSSQSTYGYERWLTFVLNSLGDPNLQLNLAGYDEFDNVEILMSEIDGIEVNTGVDSCNITLVCVDEDDNIIVDKVENVSQYTYDSGYSGKLYIYITKEGFKAFISDENPAKNLSIQGMDFYLDNNFAVKNALIGSDVIPEYESESIMIVSGGSLTLKNTGTVTITKDFECKKGGTLTINPK